MQRVKTPVLRYIPLCVTVRDAIAVKHAIMSSLLELGQNWEYGWFSEDTYSSETSCKRRQDDGPDKQGERYQCQRLKITT